jgi:hypothetical protein
MRRLLLTVGLLTAVAGPALAQPDYSRRPSFGTLNLTGGFPNDPRIVNLTAGGTLDAATLGPGCLGSVANSPDYRVNYTANGGLPLIFSVASDADTTLVINGPDGTWHCDDDGGEQGVNPAIRFQSPQSGQYDIYVGHYNQGRRIPARLYISELTSQ